MPWPNDPKHYYLIHFAPDSIDGAHKVFVTIQNIHANAGRASFVRREPQDHSDEPNRALSRLSQRIDLHQSFRNKHDAREAAYEVAHRLFSGEISSDHLVLKKTVRDYQLIGGAAFRPDVMAWEATLTIRRKRNGKRETQTFDEIQSPFRFNNFPTAAAAVEFGFQYGERMVLGHITGLKI
jgi:hypothetical protein